MVAASSSVSFCIYLLGAYIMFDIGILWGFFYLLYCLIAEIRLMTVSCVNCYYHGKWCGLGRGKIAALFPGNGDPKRFLDKNVTWKDLIPDMLVSLIPLVTGIYILFGKFDPIILICMSLLFLLTTYGNFYVRSNYSCIYCKQRELGCPAEKFFMESNKS